MIRNTSAPSGSSPLRATHVVAAAAANSPLCQAKSVRRSWPDLDIEAETTALHGLVDGLAIHLLVNPDPGFRRQALRMIEVSTDRLRPETWSPSRCASAAGTT